MGQFVSRADTAAPPLPDFVSPMTKAALKEKASTAPVNYMDLPPPVKYEEMQREFIMALKPDLFEGLRFDMIRPLTQNIFLSHGLFMGNVEVPTGNKQVFKCPMGTYEFGANMIYERFMLMARLSSEARMHARVSYDVTDFLSLKLQSQLGTEPGQTQVVADADLKGKDWNAQFKFGNPNFYGFNYFQSVTPHLSLGTECFWLQSALKSGISLAARHTGDKHVAVTQWANTGILSLQYAHKVSDKVMLCSDFMWNWNTREATTTVGYDCNLRQCRLKGKIDTNGVVSAYIQEKITPGLNFLLSAELDHISKNYKFGFGVTAGE